ncbi:hypothetical protein SAMD00019534_110440 [Acytostelium subglobosum LB1]|uniref:hypothetical protein n=1 Tax=Acytostelium subglobosum LB1 TaxID=1410327 RepID=UPI000644A804|nr:hypothetical protein SAMD00019534_110440 [Acytostelium subglobosum LB1]GAM27868.1 hypothetical protein SAMD00019534_110440 [Acytostelium subglobosum LB1]|eukprot:XP_012749151.1 hypothetical protein SAMD00019534_110440 [Acytostelium subglobosum LB1]
MVLAKKIVKLDDGLTLTRVYDSLGLPFLNRLIQTPNLPGVESISYPYMAVNLLVTFTSLDITGISHDLLESTLIFRISQHTLLPQLVKNLLHALSQRGEISESFIQDSLTFMYSMMTFESTLREMGGSGDAGNKKSGSSSYQMMSQIIQAEPNLQCLASLLGTLHQASNTKHTSPDQSKTTMTLMGRNNTHTTESLAALFDQGILVLKLLFFCFQEHNEAQCQFKRFISMLGPTSLIFLERSDDSRFSTLPVLISIFQFDGFPTHPNNQSQQLIQSAANIREGIALCLTSRPGDQMPEEQRHQVIILSSILLELFGNKWVTSATSSSTQSLSTPISSERLFALICQAVRTEVQSILMAHPVNATITQDRTNMLIACYSIMENVITYMVQQYDSEETTLMMTTDSFQLLRSVLIETNIVMIDFLRSVADHAPRTEPSKVAIMTLRQVGQFLAEEAESMEECLSISLQPIIEYFYSHGKEYGFFIAYLLPGISNYINASACMMNEHAYDIFENQQGINVLAQYFTTYLPSMAMLAMDVQESSASASSFLGTLRSYGITTESVCDTFLPHTCTIMQYYMSCWSDPIHLGNKGIFLALFIAITEAIETITANIAQMIGDALKLRQVLTISLMTLSFAILRHLNQDDFQTSEHLDHLTKAAEELTAFYQSIELPPPDQSAYIIWEEIKQQWMDTLDSLLQCLDRYPSLVNILSINRWPPTDFRIPPSTDKMANDNVIEMNRTIGHIIRKLITLKASNRND